MQALSLPVESVGYFYFSDPNFSSMHKVIREEFCA